MSHKLQQHTSLECHGGLGTKGPCGKKRPRASDHGSSALLRTDTSNVMPVAGLSNQIIPLTQQRVQIEEVQLDVSGNDIVLPRISQPVATDGNSKVARIGCKEPIDCRDLMQLPGVPVQLPCVMRLEFTHAVVRPHTVWAILYRVDQAGSWCHLVTPIDGRGCAVRAGSCRVIAAAWRCLPQSGNSSIPL